MFPDVMSNRVYSRQSFEEHLTSRLTAFVFERDVESCSIACHLAVLNRDIELDDFRDAQVANRPGGGLHCSSRGGFPGVAAGANDFSNAIDAVRHECAPLLNEVVSRNQATPVALTLR